MPIARPAKYQIACADAHCSWTVPGTKIVLEAKGFAVEQRAIKDSYVLVFRHSPKPSEGGSSGEASPIREVFFQRSLRAIEELQWIDEQKLTEAVQAPTDFSVLVWALTSDEALATIRKRDPLAGARRRGLEAKRKLLEFGGPALSSTEAAKLLKISRQAVDKRRREKKILGLELGKKGYRYPSWQFGLRTLDHVLSALGNRDDWEKLSFFLNPSGILDDRTPFEVLQESKGDLINVFNAAGSYGEHGA
jgi:hypothetical protein